MISTEVVERLLEDRKTEPGISSYLMSDSWKVVDDTQILADKAGNPILDETGSIQHVTFQTDISQTYEDLSVEAELAIKLTLLNKYRFVDGVLYGKMGTFKPVIYSYAVINRACKALGLRSYKEITEENLADFCREIVTRQDASSTSTGTYFAARSFIANMLLLAQCQIDKDALGLPDTPSCQIEERGCLEAVKPLISSSLNWKEWLKGGTLGNVPLEVALLMLQEGLDYMQSLELKSLIAIVQGVSEASIQNRVSNLNVTSQALAAFLTGSYNRDEKGVYRIFRRNREGKEEEFKVRRPTNTSYTYDIANRIFEKYEALGGNLDSIVLPSSVAECTERVRFAVYRCSAIISILSAARKSEIDSLDNDSFDVDLADNATFVSKIKKTNHSAATERPITVHAAHVAWVAMSLNRRGFHNLDVRDGKLLRVYVPWKNDPLVATNWVRKLGRGKRESGTGLKGFYEDMLACLIRDFDPEKYPLSSHRFRHTWAEIAIRRFDGNVPEAVRNYFRHCYRSFMTMDYLKDKVKADLPEISRRYMEELIHRAASGREEFFGPTGRYLLSRIREMEVLTPEGIDELLSEFDVLEVHEYSYCMMPKAQKTLAKCYDKATQTPQYGNAKWEHCGGCTGRLALANHKDVIQRIGMREQEVMASRAGLGLDALSSLSKKVIRQCEVALEDFEKHIPLVDITSEDEGIF